MPSHGDSAFVGPFSVSNELLVNVTQAKGIGIVCLLALIGHVFP